MRDFAHQTVHFAIFFGFRKSHTAKTPQRILTQNTPKDAVSGKDVPFWGHIGKNLTFTLPFFKKPPILGPILHLEILSRKTALTLEVLRVKDP